MTVHAPHLLPEWGEDGERGAMRYRGSQMKSHERTEGEREFIEQRKGTGKATAGGVLESAPARYSIPVSQRAQQHGEKCCAGIGSCFSANAIHFCFATGTGKKEARMRRFKTVL